MTNTSCKISRLKFQLKIIKVQTGLEHILALSDINSGGKVFSWGCSNYGQLGLDTRENVQFPQQIMSLRSYIIDIEVAGNTNLVLDENNRILTFGSNQQGLLGDGDKNHDKISSFPIKLDKKFMT